MKPKPLFLYTPEVAPTPALLKQIERAGYVPLAVPSFDAVKVLDLVPITQLDAISKAAMDTIAGCNPIAAAIPEAFGQRVARALGTRPQQ